VAKEVCLSVNYASLSKKFGRLVDSLGSGFEKFRQGRIMGSKKVFRAKGRRSLKRGPFHMLI